jgi:hypothetical protein
MDLSKIYSGYTSSETDSQWTIATGVDTAGNTAGTYWNTYSIDPSGQIYKWVVYNVVAGVGNDPTLGLQEVDTITVGADTTGDRASTYFTLNDGTSAGVTLYYTYFLVNNAGTILGYDPKAGKQEVSNVTPIADVSGNLASTYFTLSSPTVNYYVWFDPDYTATSLSGRCADPRVGYAEVTKVTTVADVSASLNGLYWTLTAVGPTDYYVWYTNGAGIDPAPGGTGIAVTFVNNDTAASIATKTKTALNAVGGSPFTTTASSSVLTVTNASVGAVTASAVHTSTFTVKELQKGFTAIGGLVAKVGVQVQIFQNATALQIESLMIQAINNQLITVMTATAGTGALAAITNIAGGNVTDIADGNTGFTIAVATQGVNAIGGLATATLLGPITLQYNGTAGANANTIRAFFNTQTGWKGSGATTSTIITHPIFGNPASGIADGNTSWGFGIVVGVDPTKGVYVNSIPVSYAQGATANQIGAAWRLAIQNFPWTNRTMLITGTTNNVIFTNIWNGAPSLFADGSGSGATGWTPTHNVTGNTTLQPQMGQNVASANYYIKPTDAQALFLRTINIQLSGVTTMTGFGNLAALGNGCIIQVEDVTGTIVGNAIATGIKTNGQLAALGKSWIDAANNLHVEIDLTNQFGGGEMAEIPVNGTQYQRLNFKIQDNLNTIAAFYCYVTGHQYTTMIGNG